jgi:hypothetical protein
MIHAKKALGTFGGFLCLVWMAACSSATPTSTPIPTTDLNPFRTEVAATVFAQVTFALAQTPSATPMPSLTATLLPTAEPTQTPTATPSLTATLTTGTPEEGSYQAEWVSQSIADDTIFAPGETFTMTWQMKNVGTSAWAADFMLRYYSGDAFGAPKEVPLGIEVPPGEIVDITLKMKAPAIPGNYRSDWVLATASRSNFKEPVFLKITVALPATATKTP